MADVIHELLATETAMAKLAGRGISTVEAEQVLQNAHVTVRNPRDEHGKRQLLVGRSDGGRVLTLVVEATIEPTTWLLVTGGTPPGLSVTSWIRSDEHRPVDN